MQYIHKFLNRTFPLLPNADTFMSNHMFLLILKETIVKLEIDLRFFYSGLFFFMRCFCKHTMVYFDLQNIGFHGHFSSFPINNSVNKPKKVK